MSPSSEVWSASASPPEMPAWDVTLVLARATLAPALTRLALTPESDWALMDFALAV